MRHSERGEHAVIDEVLGAVLERAGVPEALDQALSLAHLESVPTSNEAFVQFVETHLVDALIGRVHPATARALAREILDRTADDRSGARLRAPLANSPLPPHSAPTVPPPSPESVQTYQDLVSGAVHTRATPAWGLRRNQPSGHPSVWIVVSEHAELIAQAHLNAPGRTEIVIADSLESLRTTLTREDHALLSVVIDAADPSMPLDHVIAALVEHPIKARVIVWRMNREQTVQLGREVPSSRGWLHFEDEVTPPEIVQLLGA